jgi:hypothetical protein
MAFYELHRLAPAWKRARRFIQKLNRADRQTIFAGNEGKHAPSKLQVQIQRPASLRMKSMPSPRKVLSNVEQPNPVTRKVLFCAVHSRAAQHISAFAGGVVHMKNYVGDCVQVELILLLSEFDPPTAY